MFSLSSFYRFGQGFLSRERKRTNGNNFEKSYKLLEDLELSDDTEKFRKIYLVIPEKFCRQNGGEMKNKKEETLQLL